MYSFVQFAESGPGRKTRASNAGSVRTGEVAASDSSKAGAWSSKSENRRE